MCGRIAFGLAGFALLLTPLSMATATAEAPVPLTAATAPDEASQPATTNPIGSTPDTGSASGSSEILRCLAGQIPSCL